MRPIAVAASVALLLTAGFGCHNRRPSTRVMVYNQSLSAFTVTDQQVDVYASRSVYVAHGVVDTLDVKRNTVVARLVITSVVAAGDPNDYDAAVNMHEDVPGVLFCKEYGPCIDAVVIAP